MTRISTDIIKESICQKFQLFEHEVFVRVPHDRLGIILVFVEPGGDLPELEKYLKETYPVTWFFEIREL